LNTDLAAILPLAILLFGVAALYAAVGHGGASGYLAVMALFSFAPREMSTTALMLNVLVAGTAFVSFKRAGHFKARSHLLLPLAAASVPAAFLGGRLGLPHDRYALLLAAVLLLTAVLLVWRPAPRSPRDPGLPASRPSLSRTLPHSQRPAPAAEPPRPGAWRLGTAGAGIGFVSGVVGVGGGIFLSPLLVLLGWSSPHQAAALSAAFIVVNSVAGLAGRATAGTLSLGPLAIMVPVAFVGGALGASFGANRLNAPRLRRLLAIVLVIAALKLMLAGLSAPPSSAAAAPHPATAQSAAAAGACSASAESALQRRSTSACAAARAASAASPSRRASLRKRDWVIA